MKEQWRPVVGYEGFYEVSDLGRVKSLDREIHYQDGRIYFLKGRVLKNQLLKSGYVNVNLSVNGKQRVYTVHALVASAFIEKGEHDTQVNHKDGNKSSNRLDNLEWCCQSHNMKHAYKNGLAMPTRGSTSGSFKGDIEGFNIKTGETLILSGEYDIRKKGFHSGTVYACVKGKIKIHKGHTFKRIEK